MERSSKLFQDFNEIPRFYGELAQMLCRGGEAKARIRRDRSRFAIKHFRSIFVAFPYSASRVIAPMAVKRVCGLRERRDVVVRGRKTSRASETDARFFFRVRK